MLINNFVWLENIVKAVLSGPELTDDSVRVACGVGQGVHCWSEAALRQCIARVNDQHVKVNFMATAACSNNGKIVVRKCCVRRDIV